MNHKYNPTDEQRKFINDSSNFLIVSAGPGSGKTETLIQYLIKNIERKANNDKSHLKKVVVCSFTKNSTNEIKNRFSTNFNLVAGELVIFQTFDSFLINQIWKFYFGRIVRFAINHFFFQEKWCYISIKVQ